MSIKDRQQSPSKDKLTTEGNDIRTAQNFVHLQHGGQEDTNGQNDVAATTSTLAPATSTWSGHVTDQRDCLEEPSGALF